jgi:ABC-2 type transport system ATP-binding protein
MEEVELLCNRVAIIDQGQIIALDTIKNLIAILGGGVLMVGVSQVDDAMLKEISSLTSVKSASLIPAAIEAAPVEAGKEAPTGAPTGPQLKIECENSQQALINLISYMAEKDRRITALDILEPNLESVFLHLTGKKLRE